MLSFRNAEHLSHWPSAVATVLCWALAVGGATLWWLHAPQRTVVSHAALTAPAPAAPQTSAVLRALGETASEPAQAADTLRRFQLFGVVAGASGQGAALLAVDGQSPQAFVQGQTVTEGWRVHRLSPEGVHLATEGAPPVLLALPER